MTNPPEPATFITRAELAAVLKTTRLWLQPERQPGVAWRGLLLHPDDAAGDIMIAAAHFAARTDERTAPDAE